MLLSLFAIFGVALVVLAVLVHMGRSAARRRDILKRAELIRLRLQDEPGGQRVVYRKIPIRLSKS